MPIVVIISYFTIDFFKFLLKAGRNKKKKEK